MDTTSSPSSANTASTETTQPWTDLNPDGSSPVDVGLVVLDMDGTLLDGSGAVPAGFWELLPEMRSQGIVVVPASGRQYATLRSMFDAGAPSSTGPLRTYLAENGTVVVHGGNVVSTTALPTGPVRDVIAAVRTVHAAGRQVATVVCTPDVAYVENDDPDFRAQADKYYHSLQQVADLDAVLEGTDGEDGTAAPDVVKVALFVYGSVEEAASDLFTGTDAVAPQVDDELSVVLSGTNWIDIMDPTANKGVALRRLQEELGIPAERTAVFGDYLNDLEMIREGRYSFAMANAHPGITAAANYTAPANTDDGVVRVLRRILGL
ncbi:MAG TPA: Cof-type HAD-IIB family hydrolase [Candidatus Corynebacterium avicola]|uniref:Cof-type HAD-IIB family hydrolase n=1 Tax=Candidatus Corynebacterium avicola TaxID=2838527 RepID=A0A9D1RQY5_9CORY|nr:Cof-type HAD-IIB family hydrolase [Candidatus Corynebacterium avicola]